MNYGEAEQQSIAAEFAANYQANLRDRTLAFDLGERRLDVASNLGEEPQLAVGEIELIRIEAIARRQAEQREVVLGEVDHGYLTRPQRETAGEGHRSARNPGPTLSIPSGGGEYSHQTLKLSPQPHSSF